MAIFNTAILPYFSCGLPTTIPEASIIESFSLLLFLSKEERRSIIPGMANGIEDLEEKNKGRAKPKVDARYVSWMEKLGKEDSEMLMEKSSRWSAVKESRGDYDEED